MREIRFRAWDKKTKSMFNNAYVDLNYGKLELQMVKDAILLQYTGLKDKQGKEIYEGDILVRDYGFHKSYMQIIWDEDRATFGSIPARPYTYADINREQMSQCEIIGNIYENPELVEK